MTMNTIEQMEKIYKSGDRLTKGFVQLGLDIAAIIGSAYPGFIFGGRNSAGQ